MVTYLCPLLKLLLVALRALIAWLLYLTGGGRGVLSATNGLPGSLRARLLDCLGDQAFALLGVLLLQEDTVL